METRIYWQPRFEFRIEKPELDLLVKLSKRHYDGVCKSASDAADGKGRINGVLTVWSFSVESEGCPMYCTPDQMQTVLKILEDNYLHTVEAEIRAKLIRFFNSMRLQADNTTHIEDIAEIRRVVKLAANYVFDRGNDAEIKEVQEVLTKLKG